MAPDKAADIRLYKDLTGQSLVASIRDFHDNGDDLDAALSAWDRKVKSIEELRQRIQTRKE